MGDRSSAAVGSVAELPHDIAGTKAAEAKAVQKRKANEMESKDGEDMELPAELDQGNATSWDDHCPTDDSKPQYIAFYLGKCQAARIKFKR